jgi:hypothetical protein
LPANSTSFSAADSTANKSTDNNAKLATNIITLSEPVQSAFVPTFFDPNGLTQLSADQSTKLTTECGADCATNHNPNWTTK